MRASVIVTNKSLGQIIKMFGFWVTKSEIGGLLTNQKLGVYGWQRITGADPGFFKRGGANFGACGDRGCLRGLCPSEAEKICNFQS